MNKDFKYGFWIWSNKLNPVLSMLSHLADYQLSAEERDLIKEELATTNDEKGVWSHYVLKCQQYEIELSLAYDGEEGADMVHLKLLTSAELKEKLESLNLFQSLFKELVE
ncbi:MAG: hypothetical protein HEP71_26970 [Roseivirga sp.]|nr:hypothetical protein [Roseivirga sp.]